MNMTPRADGTTLEVPVRCSFSIKFVLILCTNAHEDGCWQSAYFRRPFISSKTTWTHLMSYTQPPKPFPRTSEEDLQAAFVSSWSLVNYFVHFWALGFPFRLFPGSVFVLLIIDIPKITVFWPTLRPLRMIFEYLPLLFSVEHCISNTSQRKTQQTVNYSKIRNTWTWTPDETRRFL